MGCFSNKVGVGANAEYLVNDPDQIRPIRRKRVTDGKFVLFFLGILISLGVLSHYGLSQSYPEIFINGMDSRGNVCGKKKNLLASEMESQVEDHSDHKYEFHLSEASNSLIFANLMHRKPEENVICVKECPKMKTTCEEFVQYSGKELIDTFGIDRLCPNRNALVQPHDVIFNKCILSYEYANEGYFSLRLFLQTIESTWRYKKDIFYLTCIATICTLGFFIMFEVMTKIMAVISCVLAGVFCFLLPAYFWGRFVSVRIYIQMLELSKSYDENKQLKILEAKREERLFLGFSVALTVLMIFILCCCGRFLYKREKPLGLLKEASYVACALPSTTLQPFIRIIITFALAAFALFIGAHLFFLHAPYSDKGFIGFKDDGFGYNVSLLIYLVLAVFYLIKVALGAQNVVFAGVFSKWYFIYKDDDEFPKDDYFRSRHTVNHYYFAYSFAYMVRYNFGSVCLGSLLIPPCEILRLLLASICNKIGKTTKRVRFSPGGCYSCLWKMKRILRYTFQYNYVCIAMYGLSFWKSGKEAANFLSRVPHILSMRMTASLGLFLAKTNVVFFTVFVGMIWFKSNHKMEISFEIFVPILIPSIISFFIASCFFSLHDVAMQSIILCYCDDRKRNNGRDKPYFARYKLQNLLYRPRRRMEGWTKKTLKIPMREYNDTRIFIPTSTSFNVYESKRSRPKAAKGKRRSPNDARTLSPQRDDSQDSISWDGSVQILVDRFDMFVEQMMHEREKSPLRNLHKTKTQTKAESASLPPINQLRVGSTASPFTEVSLPDQLILLDVSDDESEAFKMENLKTHLSKPVCFNVPGAQSHLALRNSPRRDRTSPPIRQQDLPGFIPDNISTSTFSIGPIDRKNETSIETRNDFSNPAEPHEPRGVPNMQRFF